MPQHRSTSRGPASLTARWGTQTPVKRATGLTWAELECLVCVAACERAERGQPIATAIQQVTKRGRGNMPSNLCALGLLENLGRTSEGLAVYGTTARGRELLELEQAGKVA